MDLFYSRKSLSAFWHISNYVRIVSRVSLRPGISHNDTTLGLDPMPSIIPLYSSSTLLNRPYSEGSAPLMKIGSR
jgi:hypothetical protein